MRKFTVAVVPIILFLLLFGGKHYDGNKFELGYLFSDADSTRLKSTVTVLWAADSLGDTLYTNALDMNPDEIEGQWTVRVYIDSVESASDSIEFDVRFGTRFDGSKFVWGPWHNIWNGMKTDSLYEKYIAQSDSTWFLNATSRQYRLLKRDLMVAGDSTSTPYVTDFLH